MTTPTSYEQQLKDEHKARQLKMALAAKALLAKKALPIPTMTTRVSRVPMLFLQHYECVLVEEMWAAVRTSPLTVAALVSAASFLGDLPPSAIKNPNRQPKPVYWRTLVWYIIHHTTDFSLPSIGRLLGGHNHTSVLSGLRRVDKALNRRDQAFDTKRDMFLIIQRAYTGGA